jgi:F420-dependent oxidoreductase-like protein
MAARVPCSVFVPQAGFDYPTLRERALLAESLGFSGVWTVDHMWARGAADVPFLDGWTVVSALAEATSRLRLGVLVTCNSYRNPGILAKIVATSDHISGGRIELGIGAGWMEEEYAAYGFPFPPVRTRLSQLEESLEIITRLFSRPRTSYRGDHYRFDDAPFEPKPRQRPLPITIGGAGPNVLMRLVARYAHRWNCPMPAASRLEEHLIALSRHCEKIGRDPGEVTVSEQIAVVVGQDDADLAKQVEVAQQRIGGFVDLETMAICGTPDTVVDRLSAKIRNGVNDFAVLFGDLGTPRSLQLFADRVAPHLTAR